MKKERHQEKIKQEHFPAVEKKLLIRLSLIIAVFSFIIYANTLHHEFVLDDGSVIQENTMTQGGVSSLKEIFSSAYRAGYTNAENNLYRPLSKAMFAVEWQLSPNNPAIHHFVNVLLYALACMLLFIVLSRWTKINVYVLFITAILFAAHPIHTEVVANIKSRDEILTMIFLLLSLNAVLNYIRSSNTSSLIAYLFYFFLALLSKESAVVFIGIVPLFIYFFTAQPLKKNLQLTFAAAGVAIVSLIIHKSVTGSIGLDNIPVIDNSLLATSSVFLQKATAVMIMGRYLLLLIFPHPLSSDYSFDTIPIVSGPGDPAFLAALAVHVFLLVYAIRKLKGKHLLSFCILFYLVSMAIASNIFMTIGTHLAERLLFFPSIAYCLALSYLICRSFKISITEHTATFGMFMRTGKPYVFLMAALLLLFTLKTTARNKDWRSNGELFAKDMETVPNSAHMLMYYSDFLLKKDNLDKLSPEARQAQLLKAKASIERALKIYELFPDAHYLAGRARYELKDYEGAYKEYFRATSLNPGKAMYHNNAGTSLFALGRYSEAETEFEKAMDLNPADPDPPFNIGSAYGAMGEGYRVKGDSENAKKMFNMAIPNFQKAIRMKPDYKSAYQFLGATYMNMGDTLNGKAYLDKAAQVVERKK
jgi:tetratricopeptide (TPR) repeat protein